jgi:hypothetical protein
MDTKGIVSLDYAVHMVLMDLDDYTNTFYKKYLQYAILGFQDLNLFVNQSVKVAYLTVGANKTAPLPDDYITYTKIGYNNGGVVATLGLNNDLMMPHQTNDCGDLVNDNLGDCGNESSGDSSAVVPSFGYYFSAHYRNGQFVGEQYGGAGGRHNDGTYRIDEERRLIVFNSEVAASEIILEYKSSGIKGDGSTMVKREFIPAIRAYIHWQRRAYNDNVAESKKRELRDQYYLEFDMVKGLEGSFTIEEYLDSTRGTFRQSPKR